MQRTFSVPNIPLMHDVLAALWDRLAAFPDLTIDWRADIGLVDVVDAQIDVGLRFGTPWALPYCRFLMT